MTFRTRGKSPEPTEEIRALVVLLLPDIDVFSAQPDRWSIMYHHVVDYLPITASFEEWQAMLQKIVNKYHEPVSS